MSRATEEYELTINMMGKDYRELVAKYEGYRKALEQIREMHYYDSSATEMRQIAREALSDAATPCPTCKGTKTVPQKLINPLMFPCPTCTEPK